MPTLPKAPSLKTPFPWYGGKSDAAAEVWEALGDVDHYVEPFFGGGAVLLHRPHLANRGYFSETVNDIDGWIVNFWRAVRADPQAVAEWASWPVTELDKQARGVRVKQWRESEASARLAGDAEWYDAQIAGWWVWVQCGQIGMSNWHGPWWPDEEGKLRKGIRSGPGIKGDLPHLTNDGVGVNRPQLKEPGIKGDLPHLTNDGVGVNHANLREPGLAIAADYEETEGFHPVTMPKLRWWMHYLQARLRHVRIVNGDWTRVCTMGAVRTLAVRHGGVAGVFLDPPYGDVGRASLYGKHEDFDVAADVRHWCLEYGDRDDLRIVYAGYDEEGVDLEQAGWRTVEWFRPGFLKGGMGNIAEDGHQQHRERLWLSPLCLTKDTGDGRLFSIEG